MRQLTSQDMGSVGATVSATAVEWLVENTGPLPVVVNLAIRASAPILAVSCRHGRAQAQGSHATAVVCLAAGATARLSAVLEPLDSEPVWADVSVAAANPLGSVRLASSDELAGAAL